MESNSDLPLKACITGFLFFYNHFFQGLKESSKRVTMVTVPSGRLDSKD